MGKKRNRTKPALKSLKSRSVRQSSRGNRASTRDILGKSPKRIPPQWSWHYKTLLQFRERLLRGQQEHVREIVEQLEPHSMSAADSATDEFDHDLALSELSASQNALFEIDEALKRILNGTYGVCEETGVAIPEMRLRAIPWTRFSKESETRLEKQGVVKTPSLGVLHSLREAGNENSLPETAEEIEVKEKILERPKALIERAISEPPKIKKTEESENEE